MSREAPGLSRHVAPLLLLAFLVTYLRDFLGRPLFDLQPLSVAPLDPSIRVNPEQTGQDGSPGATKVSNPYIISTSREKPRSVAEFDHDICLRCLTEGRDRINLLKMTFLEGIHLTVLCSEKGSTRLQWTLCKRDSSCAPLTESKAPIVDLTLLIVKKVGAKAQTTRCSSSRGIISS